MESVWPGAIALPDGTLVRGRGRREPPPGGPEPEFGLYLGTAAPPHGRSWFRRGAPWLPDWTAEWIEWPDFRTPRDGLRAARQIQHAHELAAAGRRVEVACSGGTGRTGTVIACMAILSGHPPEDAVAWTRRTYRPRAVETPGQRRWVAWFGRSTAGP